MRLLLVHGAGLGSWIWDRVRPLLRTPSVAIDLPGRAGNGAPGEVTARHAIETIRRHFDGQTRDVLVGHSFGAQFVLAAAALDPARVAGVALAGGVTPASGENFLSLMPGPMRLFMKIVFKRSSDGVKLPEGAVRKEYCNDLDEATTALVMSRLTREAPHYYLDGIDWSALPQAIPRAYIQLAKDKSTSPKTQLKMIERTGATLLETLNTGHLPMLADPRACAAALDRIALTFAQR